MKFCRKPFEQMYVAVNYVKTCPWMDIVIGNPLEQSLDEIWKGDKAEESRNSIRDGSFRYCDKVSCPYCASGRLEELDDEIVSHYQVEENPVNMNISYDKFCNHACPSCRSQIYRPDEDYKSRMKRLKEVVLPFASKTQTISTCGMGDCFASPFMMEFLEELFPERDDFRITFETNGVFFDQRHWDRISHLHRYPISVIVTPNSFERYTYRYLAGGIDDWEKCMQSMKFLSELRKHDKIASLKINMVVQESNYREIPSFIEYCLEELNPDGIRIKPLNRWFALNAEGYWFMNVLNPAHPHHENYLAVMSDPILKHPKVWDWTEENHDRDYQLHPAAYAEIYADLLSKLIKCEDMQDYLNQKFKNYNVKDISIYGAWKWGGVLYDAINQVTEININSFIDKRKGNKGKTFKNLPVIGLWNPGVCDDDMIVVSVLSSYDAIVRDLRNKGYKGIIISAKELL